MSIEQFRPQPVDEGGFPAQASGLIAWAEKAVAAASIARQLAGTSFVPESLRVRDDSGRLMVDETVMQVTGALLKGDELGFSPMASLEVITIIPPGSGRPFIAGKAVATLIEDMGGAHFWTVEESKTRVILKGRKRNPLADQPDETAQWTSDRAKDLVGNSKFTDPRGNWRKQQQTMLYWRAVVEIGNKIAPGVMLGVHVAETADDYAEDEQEDGAADSGTTPTPRKRAASPTPGSRKRSAPVSHLPRPGGQAAEGSAAESGEQPGTDTEGDPSTGRRPEGLSDSQRTALWAGMQEIMPGAGREAWLRQLGQWLEREVPSSNTLTGDEASRCLDKIREVRDREAVSQAQEQAAEQSQDEGPGAEPTDDPEPE